MLPMSTEPDLSRNRRPSPLRQTIMKTKPGHRGRNLALLITIALTAAIATACGSRPVPAKAEAGTKASVPAGFRHACGHPGAKVRVTHLPVTIKHSACDLTGVSITVRGGEGAVVPESGGVGAAWDGIDSAHGGSLTITVADHTRDVTITGTGSARR
jgi:hypothetical protein